MVPDPEFSRSAMTTNPPIVDIRDLIFRYGGTEVLHSISFSLGKGEIIGSGM